MAAPEAWWRGHHGRRRHLPGVCEAHAARRLKDQQRVHVRLLRWCRRALVAPRIATTPGLADALMHLVGAGGTQGGGDLRRGVPRQVVKQFGVAVQVVAEFDQFIDPFRDPVFRAAADARSLIFGFMR